MPADRECFSCVQNARRDPPPRERIYSGPTWRVAHAFGTSLPGWLVVVPRRHVIALDELTPEEAADIGPLLSGLTSALRHVVNCAKTYVALFAEAEGFQHLHFHVVPRQPDQGADLRGPRIGGLTKAVRSSASPRDYRRIRQYADEFRKRRTVYQ